MYRLTGSVKKALIHSTKNVMRCKSNEISMPCISGGTPELGDWNVGDSIVMDGCDYPRWVCQAWGAACFQPYNTKDHTSSCTV